MIPSNILNLFHDLRLKVGELGGLRDVNCTV